MSCRVECDGDGGCWMVKGKCKCGCGVEGGKKPLLWGPTPKWEGNETSLNYFTHAVVNSHKIKRGYSGMKGNERTNDRRPDCLNEDLQR